MTEELTEPQEQPWLLFSLICGVCSAIAALLKAFHMAEYSGISGRLAPFSVFIAFLAIAFCFVSLLVYLGVHVAGVSTLAHKRTHWKRGTQLLWWIHTVAFVGTCSYVFLNFERGSVSLFWKYSSSLAFILGLGQISFFAFYQRHIDQSLQRIQAP